MNICPECGQAIKKDTRSLKQNKLYWGVWLNEISYRTGNEVEYLHEYFKGEFLEAIVQGFEPKKVMGKWIIPEMSTKKLSVKQFTEYLNRIERFANIEIGVQLSHPESLYQEAMGRHKRG